MCKWRLLVLKLRSLLRTLAVRRRAGVNFDLSREIVSVIDVMDDEAEEVGTFSVFDYPWLRSTDSRVARGYFYHGTLPGDVSQDPIGAPVPTYGCHRQ